MTSCFGHISALPHSRTFIALGDSVPSGFGLTGYRYDSGGSYPSLLFEKLYREGYVDEFINMAVSGFTTTMLLEHLNSLDAEARSQFRNAEYVTLNIGGNNILTPFIEYLLQLRLVYGADNFVDGAADVLEGMGAIFSWLWGTFVEDNHGNNTDIDVVEGLGDIIFGLRDMFFGAGNMILGTPEAVAPFAGLFSPELAVMLLDGVDLFYHEFVEIIAWIEAAAPSATIIVNTVFNPIPPQVLFFSLSLSRWASILIGAINDVIIVESEERGYYVVNVYEYMSNRLDLMAFNLNPFGDGDISFDIIHPNAQGHALIAQMNFDEYTQRRD